MQPRHAVQSSASPAETPLQSKLYFSLRTNLPCSYLVPFVFRGTVWLCGRVPRLPAFLQFLADHTNLEENAARFDAQANAFQLRRSYLLRAVRDVEKNTLELIE